MTIRAEPVGRIGRAAHLRVASIESSLRRIRLRPSLRSARARSARARSARARSARTLPENFIDRAATRAYVVDECSTAG
jgi:hypothetical protein